MPNSSHKKDSILTPLQKARAVTIFQPQEVYNPKDADSLTDFFVSNTNYANGLAKFAEKLLNVEGIEYIESHHQIAITNADYNKLQQHIIPLTVNEAKGVIDKALQHKQIESLNTDLGFGLSGARIKKFLDTHNIPYQYKATGNAGNGTGCVNEADTVRFLLDNTAVEALRANKDEILTRQKEIIDTHNQNARSQTISK